MERYFDFKDTSVSKKYKLAKLKLPLNAVKWLQTTQQIRQLEGRDKIDSWYQLKNHMRRKYVPAH